MLPFDLERLSTLNRGPRAGCAHGHTTQRLKGRCALETRQFDDRDDASHRFGSRIIQRLHFAPDDRRACRDGEELILQAGVDSINRAAGDDLLQVGNRRVLADIPPFVTRLEFHALLRGNLQLPRNRDKFAESERFAGASVFDLMQLGVTFARINLPLFAAARSNMVLATAPAVRIVSKKKRMLLEPSVF